MEKKPFNIQSLLQHPVSMVIVAMLLIWLSSFLSVRIDLTAEKRFSLTPASKTILQNLDTTIQVDVLLDGSLSADYKKLRNAVVDILNEFRSVSGGLVQVKIGIDLPNKQDSAVALIYDSLASTHFGNPVSSGIVSDRACQKVTPTPYISLPSFLQKVYCENVGTTFFVTWNPPNIINISQKVLNVNTYFKFSVINIIFLY